MSCHFEYRFFFSFFFLLFFVFFFFILQRDVWDLSSKPGIEPVAPCNESVESSPLNHWGSLRAII